MRKYLVSVLFSILSICVVIGMDGIWTPLDPSLMKEAKTCAELVSKVNADLGREAQSRNTLAIFLSKPIIMISGFPPLQEFSTEKLEVCHSFIDVLIGKKKSETFRIIANESKAVFAEFQKAFRTLKAKPNKSAEETSLFTLMGTLGINEGSSLADIGKCFDACSAFISHQSMSAWKNASDRFTKCKTQLNAGNELLLEYLTALDGYVNFLSTLRPEEELEAAKKEIVFLQGIARHLPCERIIDVISENSACIIKYTHTETLLAYIMFSKKINPEIDTLKKELLALFEEEKFVMLSHRDMCSICEATWGHFANKRGKRVVVFSNKEHEGSHLRDSKESLLQKIPLSSDMHVSWKTINRDAANAKWREIFLYNFSTRMCVLFNKIPEFQKIIEENRVLIPEDGKTKDDSFLFDRLIDKSSLVVRASEIYNHYARAYFAGTTAMYSVSPYMPIDLKSLQTTFETFFK